MELNLTEGIEDDRSQRECNWYPCYGAKNNFEQQFQNWTALMTSASSPADFDGVFNWKCRIRPVHKQVWSLNQFYWVSLAFCNQGALLKINMNLICWLEVTEKSNFLLRYEEATEKLYEKRLVCDHTCSRLSDPRNHWIGDLLGTDCS